MSLSISGSQFNKIGDVKIYVVTGIPTGYTLNDIELPNGWTQHTIGTISAGSQSLTFDVGIGSGTIIVSYIKSGNILTVYYDVYVGVIKMGEELIQDGGFVITSTPIPKTSPVFSASSFTGIDCPFVLNVFADVSNPTNDLFNDKSDFYGNIGGVAYYADLSVSNIQLILQKNTSACGDSDWIDKITFSDNTYGSFLPFGKNPDFSGNNFIDDFNKKYTGLLLNWIKVLQAYGEGNYRMKVIYTPTFGGSNVTAYDVRIFCLHQKTDYNLNKTVRIETLNQGLRGCLDDNTIQIDYGTGWYGQMRLPGIFYEIKPSYNKEYNQYGDADYNALRPVISELVPKFTMDIIMVPGWIDWILENIVLLADEILITDYNQSNRKTFIKTPVVNEDGIEIKDEVFMNQLAWSKISFSYGQNNLRKRNS